MHIIITEDNDLPTTKVANLLESLKEKVLLIDVRDEMELLNFLSRNEMNFRYKDFNFGLEDIKSVWFRRGRIKVKYSYDESPNDKNLQRYHFRVKNEIENFVNYAIFTKVRTLGNPFKTDLNKLMVNDLAEKIGFNIPKSLLTDRIEDINTFIENNKEQKIISKLLIPLHLKENGKKLDFLTHTVDMKKLKSNNFTTSFFQSQIEKVYEIRSFFLNGKLYSKAIFSQNDQQTKVDYRNYNLTKPNREVPYNLPNSLRLKIIELMSELSLNTGSIDLIFSKDKKYYFLEVNPIGQFSDLSFSCNYNLENKIVEYLNEA